MIGQLDAQIDLRTETRIIGAPHLSFQKVPTNAVFGANVPTECIGVEMSTIFVEIEIICRNDVFLRFGSGSQSLVICEAVSYNLRHCSRSVLDGFGIRIA